MLIPIRCFTCGKPLGAEYEQYKEKTEKGEDPQKVLTDLKVERYCCRRMIISQPNIDEELVKYKL